MTSSERIDEALSDKAIEWVVLLHSGHETPADHEAFARWRAIDRRHEMAAREAEAIWQGIGAAGRTIRGDARCKSRTRMTRRAVLGLGAVGLVGGGLVPSGLVRLTFLSDYATGIGEWKTIALSDGSTVQLNARSALSVGFDRTRRLVSLTEGQAAFSVADDPARPFLVSAAGGQTMAAGSQFDVDIRPDDVAVTILHGDVSVSTEAAGRAVTATEAISTVAGLAPRPVSTFFMQRLFDRDCPGRTGRVRQLLSVRRSQACDLAAKDEENFQDFCSGLISFAYQALRMIVTSGNSVTRTGNVWRMVVSTDCGSMRSKTPDTERRCSAAPTRTILP